jgi:hypothetical protein
MAVMTADGSALPLWVRRAFWTVVAAEWAVTLVLGAVILAAFVWVATSFALACSPDTTVYAGGYSDAAWASVAVDDTHTAVVARLGEPLERWRRSNDEWWSYSRQGTGTENYRERKLRFAIHGRVAEKIEACYVD